MTAYMRELLAASTRRGRDPHEDDEPAAARPRARTPGKQRADEDGAGVLPCDPGKRSRAAEGTAVMSPAHAVAFADWMTRVDRIDRRAEAALDDEGGALSAAFGFLAEERSGQPLPDELRRRLAAELGVDLAPVRVHTGGPAARAAAALGARAFTIGEDIYFAASAYAPTSLEGIELIAHEVAHVVQQRGQVTAASGPAQRVSRAGDRQEQEADAFSRGFAERLGRVGDDPAEALNRMRAEATPVPLPFQGELERHFGTSFVGVEAFIGEAARKACQLLAASAFAVRNIVALAGPSPRREQLLHELAHVVQMGKAAAPASFAAGTLRVGAAGSPAERDAEAAVGHGRVTVAADPDVIHRDPDPDPPRDDVSQRPQTLADRLERVDAYLDTVPERAQGDEVPPVFVDPGNTTEYYRHTSAGTFTLDEYRTWVRSQPAWSDLTDAQLATDLTDVLRANQTELVRCGATGRKWGWIAAHEPHPSIVELHDKAVASSEATVGSLYELYCDALTYCTSLTPKPIASLKSQPDMDVTWSTASGPQPINDGDLRIVRQAIRTAVTGCEAYWLANGEWRQFFEEVVKAPVKFPQKMVGDMFEEIAARDLRAVGMDATRVGVVFAKDPQIDALATQQTYIGDGLLIEGTSLRIMEMKTGPVNPGAVDEDGETADGTLLAKAAAYAAILKYAVHATNIKGVTQTGPFDQCIYIFVTQEIAKAWATKLRTVFEGHGVADRLVVYPDPGAEGVATLEFNPTFEVPLDDLSSTTHHLTNPAIVHPGVTFRAIDLTTTTAGSTEIASGSVTMDVDLAGGVQGQSISRPVTPEGGVGHVDNQLEGLHSSLGDALGGLELGVSAKLTDDGVEASIQIPPGPSGILDIDIVEGSVITATYTTSGELAITGAIRLAHTSGNITGEVQVAWAAGQWSFTGSAAVAEGLIDGLSSFEAQVSYDGGRWSFGVDQVSYQKQIGAITLTGTALGVMYDVEAGSFSGQVELDADLGMFGHAGASATLENNQLTSASFSYDSPELCYPRDSEAPSFRGWLGGTITYADGAFSGAITGTANLDIPALQAVAGEAGIGLEVDAQINADGSYGGTIALAAGTSLQLGKHLEVPSLSCTIEPDGSLSGAFAIKVVKIKYLEEARIECTVDATGVRIVRVEGAASVPFGSEGQGQFWGTLSASYSEATGLSIGGEVSYQIKEGMIATGTLTYASDTGEVSLAMEVDEITLLDREVSRTLFRADKQIPVMNAAGIGIYLDLGFTLGFNYAFHLGVKPTIELEGLSLEDFTFDRIQASLELVGDGISAELTGTPTLGIGVFALSPSILRGGGGITIPIVGKAWITPSGVVSLQYTPDGGVTGDSTDIGMALTFGITGSVTPYAELSVLDGMFEPRWDGDALTSFEILPPKEIFNFTLDLAGDMTTQEPALPDSNAAGAPVESSAGTVLPEEHEEPADVNGPAASATAEGPTAPVAETGDQGPFSLAAMAPLLEALPGAASIKALLDKAGAAWERLGELAGRVMAAFQSYFSTLADRMMEILDGLATQGLDYLPTLVRMIIGDAIYEIIEPAVSGSSAALLVLFETDPPTDLARLPAWAWEIAFGAVLGGESLVDQGIELLKEAGSTLIEEGGDLIEGGVNLIEGGVSSVKEKGGDVIDFVFGGGD